MANTTKINDVSYDGCLHSLYRMGFESARVDDSTSRAYIRDYGSNDRLLRNLDGGRKIRSKKDGQMITNVLKYFKRIWCAVLNKKCNDDCDCNVK